MNRLKAVTRTRGCAQRNDNALGRPFLTGLNLGDKAAAIKAWCDKTGAAGVADISGDYVEQFVAALEPRRFELPSRPSTVRMVPL